MDTPKIETASVKVMRSHDYCHFEVNLSSTEANSPEAVNALRKVAARLADKAVSQYRLAKINAAKLLSEKNEREGVVRRAMAIEAIEEGERTVNQQAVLKAVKDDRWKASRLYDYEDDWDDDHDDGV